MAAFTSNIDITSGGTYGMNITNGMPASQVANDLNGKFANIQRYLQNGLPEVWTGDTLPDSLPDGKLVLFNNILHSKNNIFTSSSTIENMSITEIKGSASTANQTIQLPIAKYMFVYTYIQCNTNTTSQYFQLYFSDNYDDQDGGKYYSLISFYYMFCGLLYCNKNNCIAYGIHQRNQSVFGTNINSTNFKLKITGLDVQTTWNFICLSFN